MFSGSCGDDMTTTTIVISGRYNGWSILFNRVP